MGSGAFGSEASGAFGKGPMKHGGVAHCPPSQKNWLLEHGVSQPPQ